MHRLLMISEVMAAWLTYVEVSVRGQISKANRARLNSFLLKTTGLRRNVSVELICKLSRVSLLSSFTIFCARGEPSWQLDRSITVLITKIGMQIALIYYSS